MSSYSLLIKGGVSRLKNVRYIICVIAAIYLIMEAAPLLPIEGKSSATVFTSLWILFACFVLSGNLLSLKIKGINKNKKRLRITKWENKERQLSR